MHMKSSILQGELCSLYSEIVCTMGIYQDFWSQGISVRLSVPRKKGAALRAAQGDGVAEDPYVVSDLIHRRYSCTRSPNCMEVLDGSIRTEYLRP